MALSQKQREYLQLMGIPVWNERAKVQIVDEANQNQEVELPTASNAQTSNETKPENLQEQINVTVKEVFVPPEDVLKRAELPESWSKLIDVVAECKRCELHQTRTQTVFGVGNTEADWMIIGEAPGADEDKQGEPFVGRAGQLLTTILESIGLSREKVYITNTLKCRPPNNRDPKPIEAAQCRAYLEQQITLVNPKIILCVGRIATQNLLNSKDPLSRLRGKIHTLIHPGKPEKNIPVVATYHPAYLLRSPSQKRKVWDDLKVAYELVNTE